MVSDAPTSLICARLRGCDVGALPESALVSARVALSIPLVLTYTHAAVAGPVLASHPLDLQAFPPVEGDKLADVAHVGPASVNIEAKLVGVDDEKMEKGADPYGELCVRGPSVGVVAGGEGDDDWMKTGSVAQVYTNGAFKVVY